MTFPEMQTKFHQLEKLIELSSSLQKSNHIRISEDDGPHNVHVDDVSCKWPIERPSTKDRKESLEVEAHAIFSKAVHDYIGAVERKIDVLKKELGIVDEAEPEK